MMRLRGIRSMQYVNGPDELSSHWVNCYSVSVAYKCHQRTHCFVYSLTGQFSLSQIVCCVQKIWRTACRVKNDSQTVRRNALLLSFTFVWFFFTVKKIVMSTCYVTRCHYTTVTTHINLHSCYGHMLVYKSINQ